MLQGLSLTTASSRYQNDRRHRRRRPHCAGVFHRIRFKKHPRSTKGNSVHETTRYGISPLSWCARPMTRALQFAAVLAMLFAAAVTTPAISKAAADGQCAHVEVIFDRGTIDAAG